MYSGGDGRLDFDMMKAEILAQPTLEALDAKGKEYRERVKNEAKTDKQKYAANGALDRAYKARKEELQGSKPGADVPTVAEMAAFNPDQPPY